MVEKPN